MVAWIGPLRDWFNRRVRTEEAYADMASVAYFARYHPAQFSALVGQVALVRKRFREPKHDTLAWLDSAMSDEHDDTSKNLFFLAHKRLSRYQ